MMAKRDFKILKSHKNFDKVLSEVQYKRLLAGKEKKPLSKTRLTLAISRIPNLKELLINSEIKKK